MRSIIVICAVAGFVAALAMLHSGAVPVRAEPGMMLYTPTRLEWTLAETHSSPDLFARLIAIGGIVLSILGLGLAVSNSLWQRKIQEESTAERILVHLDASRIANKLLKTEISLSAEGEVGMEVVNIGMRPLFIKRADMRISGRFFTFYEHDPTKTNEPMKSLAPSEPIRYRLSWNFGVAEATYLVPQNDVDVFLIPYSSPIEDIEVQVHTTKKTFSFPHQIVNVAVVPSDPQRRKSTSKQSPDH